MFTHTTYTIRRINFGYKMDSTSRITPSDVDIVWSRDRRKISNDQSVDAKGKAAATCLLAKVFPVDFVVSLMFMRIILRIITTEFLLWRKRCERSSQLIPTSSTRPSCIYCRILGFCQRSYEWKKYKSYPVIKTHFPVDQSSLQTRFDSSLDTGRKWTNIQQANSVHENCFGAIPCQIINCKT